jgi:hypothetical protein
MAEAPFHSGDFPHGRSRAQPYIPACFLNRDWKILGRALELAIQIP